MTRTRVDRSLGWITANGQRFPQDRIEDALEATLAGFCPFCGAGPFIVPASHTVKMHNVGGVLLRKWLGLNTDEPTADPTHTADKRRRAIEDNKAALLIPYLAVSKRGRTSHRKGLRDPKLDAPPEPPVGLPDHISHGGHTAYNKYGCRCPACREHHREEIAAKKARRLARPIPDHIHGRPTTYTNYLCRCDPCFEAFSRQQRDYRERRRTG